MHLESLLTALQPVFQTPELNKSIIIFEGNFTICEDVEDRTSLPCSGLIQWCWLPSPKLTFEANFHEVQPSDLHKVHQAFHSPKMQVHIPNMAPLRAMPTNLELFGGSMKGSLVVLHRPNENIELTDLVFHIPNFPNYRGRGIKYNSNAYRTGRLALQAAGWEVLIDNLPDTDRLVKPLQSNSGYAIIHIGSLKRINSTSFRLEEAESFMEYLSF
ncbi:MAG: hypothetical protein EOP45_21760 [Sphingobacteriaceae bacterium]|nr:MAG: hypothetical protein EOP45_21760 [Sphingobacteriaceae bacterium]